MCYGNQKKTGGPRGCPAVQTDCKCNEGCCLNARRSRRPATKNVNGSTGSKPAGESCRWQKGQCLNRMPDRFDDEESSESSPCTGAFFVPVTLQSSPKGASMPDAPRAKPTVGASDASRITKHASQAANRCIRRCMVMRKRRQRRTPKRRAGPVSRARRRLRYGSFSKEPDYRLSGCRNGTIRLME